MNSHSSFFSFSRQIRLACALPRNVVGICDVADGGHTKRKRKKKKKKKKKKKSGAEDTEF